MSGKDTHSDSAKGSSASEIQPPNLNQPPAVIDRHDFGSDDTPATQPSDIFNFHEEKSRLPHVDTSSSSSASIPTFHLRQPSITPTRSPLSAGLHLQTDFGLHALLPVLPSDVRPETVEGNSAGTAPEAMSQSIPTRDGYFARNSLSAASIGSYRSSPGSVVSSPALAAMTDITPLPSPLIGNESPGPWRRVGHNRGGSAGSTRSMKEEILPEEISDEPAVVKICPTKKKKAYGSLITQAIEASSSAPGTRYGDAVHERNRSISDFTPQDLHNVRQRNVTIAGTQTLGEAEPSSNQMQREAYLAAQRGFATQQSQQTMPPPVVNPALLPTPPPSNRSMTGSEGAEPIEDSEPCAACYTIRTGKRKRQYRPVRPLGQGTFSRVVLATDDPSIPARTLLNEVSEPSLNPKHLVAIKIVEHGPAGGADEERIELGLKREIELLRSISHPSIIQLKSFDFNDTEALLVLSYCPGGDLFDLASTRRDCLSEPIVRRLFAELVDAVGYLHSQWIVHRDLKLENVLLNVQQQFLSPASLPRPATYPHPLITLTDLGLSRHIPKPPESPLLTTRCGSEDYAAPEILLAQPYDGRQTDAWALGVLLYALMEGRLPFDAPPVKPGQRVIARGRSKASHRIARCEWIWSRFGDDDGEWDPVVGKEWEGARAVVEGLLKKVSRGRWTVEQLQSNGWVQSGIQLEDGSSSITKIYDLNKVDRDDESHYHERGERKADASQMELEQQQQQQQHAVAQLNEDTEMQDTPADDNEEEANSIIGAEERANKLETRPHDDEAQEDEEASHVTNDRIKSQSSRGMGGISSSR